LLKQFSSPSLKTVPNTASKSRTAYQTQHKGSISRNLFIINYGSVKGMLQYIHINGEKAFL
jgi:hypothetical protein